MKKESYFAISFLLILLVIAIYKQYNTKLALEESQTENYDLESQVEDLETQLEQLQSELEEAIDEKDRYETLYEVTIANMEDDEYGSSNSYNYYNTVDNNDYKTIYISVSNTLQTIYYDSGNLIKPSLENLHLLISLDQSSFSEIMRKNNYSFSNTGKVYVNESTKNCCYTVDKNLDSVTLIFTRNIQNNLEKNLMDKDIKYSFEKGFKKYKYTLRNKKYVLYYRSLNNELSIILKKF